MRLTWKQAQGDIVFLHVSMFENVCSERERETDKDRPRE